MFLLDSLLVNGIRFVLDKVATVADQELNDPQRQQERLLEAQMRLEAGDIDEAQFSAIEADVFDRLRAARADAGGAVVDDEHRIAGVDIVVDDDAS